MAVDYNPEVPGININPLPDNTSNISVTRTPYHETGSFRFWCQKVLPLVYDDSLSYYELLCKVVNFLNEVIENVDNLHTENSNVIASFGALQNYVNANDAAMTQFINASDSQMVDYINSTFDDFQTAYNQLQTYVNDYFDNLDVQEEINNKLDEMAEDGSLGEVIEPYLIEYQRQLDLLDARLDNLESNYTPGSTTADAELIDVRVGADGVTYATAGNAVRTQVSDLKSKITNVDGIVVPAMQLGTIAMSSSSIVFNDSTSAIRTPQLGGVPVKNGDVVKLTDYTNAKFRVSIYQSSGTYSYIPFTQQDYIVPVNGTLYLVVSYADDSTVTDVHDLASMVRIITSNGIIPAIDTEIAYLKNHENILENNHFISSLFGAGDMDSQGNHLQTVRKYRVSTLNPITLTYDAYLMVDPLYRFVLLEKLNGVWTRRGGSSAWLNFVKISAGIEAAICIAKVTEDTASTADVDTFVSKITVNSNLTSVVNTASVDETAISTFMGKFYASNQAEAYTFFTDPHLMGLNGEFDINTYRQYINILAETVKRTSAMYVVCGGDWLNNGDTKEQASVKLGFVQGEMSALFGDKYYPIAGNHDYNYLGVDSGGNRLTEANWVANPAMHNFWFSKYENCYYKFKNAVAQNYVLNTRTDYDGTNTYDKAMLDWLAGELITDDPAHSTIMFHMYYLSTVGTTIPTRVVAIGKMISAFNAHTVCTLTAATEGYDKTYDFTGTTGHIDYVLVGHSHADFSDTLGGVPVIGCKKFVDNNIATFDLIFADYTNEKLYTIRVGNGDSREFDI